MELCRDHNIRHVFITTSSTSSIGDLPFCLLNYILEFTGQFAEELCKLGVTLDVYERSGSDASTFFNTSSLRWDQIANSLRHDGISLRMTTAFDVTFRQKDYPFGIKSHIRIEKTENATEPLAPVEIARGFTF